MILSDRLCQFAFANQVSRRASFSGLGTYETFYGNYLTFVSEEESFPTPPSHRQVRIASTGVFRTTAFTPLYETYNTATFFVCQVKN
jgi:hypothetical protein